MMQEESIDSIGLDLFDCKEGAVDSFNVVRDAARLCVNLLLQVMQTDFDVKDYEEFLAPQIPLDKCVALIVQLDKDFIED